MIKEKRRLEERGKRDHVGIASGGVEIKITNNYDSPYISEVTSLLTYFVHQIFMCLLIVVHSLISIQVPLVKRLLITYHNGEIPY